MRETLTSLQNPKIKQAVKLNERRERNQTGLFIIEGYRELLRAADGHVVVKTLFICPEFFLGTNEEDLILRFGKTGADIVTCDPRVFEKLSYRDRPDGLIGVAVQMKRDLSYLKEKLLGKKDPFLVLAESIEKPGNLGTILRSADAAGVDGVIVCDRCTDIYNPNVVRASVGTLFTVPVVESSSADLIDWLRSEQIRMVAATPAAEQEFTRVDMSGGIAIAVGTEQLGLSAFLMGTADVKVRIPMHGTADSLNVATATTLLLYEVVRQRS